MSSELQPSRTAEKSRFSIMAVTAIHHLRLYAWAKLGAMTTGSAQEQETKSRFRASFTSYIMIVRRWNVDTHTHKMLIIISLHQPNLYWTRRLLDSLDYNLIFLCCCKWLFSVCMNQQKGACIYSWMGGLWTRQTELAFASDQPSGTPLLLTSCHKQKPLVYR